MTENQKVQNMIAIIGENDVDYHSLSTCLQLAKSKILNRRFPFVSDHSTLEVESCYEYLQVELAVVIYNQKGVEGESSHSENGINRQYRSEAEILAEITSKAGIL